MNPEQTIDTDRWFSKAELKLIDAIIASLGKGDWQAVWEDATIGKALFKRSAS